MTKDLISEDDKMLGPITPYSDVYARSVMRTLTKTRETTGYWRHSLTKWIF
ncbi:Estradiol 17-beta-dehydrogenase 12-B, partial [Caligus rogercresseyi]